LKLKQQVARRHLDDGGDVAAGANRHPQHRHRHVENRVAQLFHAESVVLLFFVPLDQLDHLLDLFGVAHRGDTKEIFDVDNDESANLHVVLDDGGARSINHVGRPFANLDDVVGYQAVAAQHQIERRFTLADARFTQEQNTDTENIDEYAVDAGGGRQSIFEQ